MSYEISRQCYKPQPSAPADNENLDGDNSRYHAKHHPVIAYFSESHSVIWRIA